MTTTNTAPFAFWESYVYSDTGRKKFPEVCRDFGLTMDDVGILTWADCQTGIILGG